MTPEEKSLLERTYKMTEENNALLRSIRRGHRFSTFLRVVYWIIIAGAGLAAYYALQPYITSVTQLYDQAKSLLPK